MKKISIHLKTKNTFVHCLSYLLLASGFLYSQDAPIFEERGELVVIETESAETIDGWSEENSIIGFTGESYLFYPGQNFFNKPGNAKITYRISITNPGRYRFQWRSRIAVGSENTEHNDSWLRFPDAPKFYAEKEGARLYPGGTGLSPNPAGSSLDGWFKIYQNKEDAWTWQTRTSDHDPHDIFVEFDSAGVYTLEVSGRSQGHAIDRMILYSENVLWMTAQNLDQPESNILSTVSKVDFAISPLQLFPNPVEASLRVEIPGQAGKTDYIITILDIAGRSHFVERKGLLYEAQIQVPVDFLPNGIYWIRLQTPDKIFQGRFVKVKK